MLIHKINKNMKVVSIILDAFFHLFFNYPLIEITIFIIKDVTL